MVEVVVVMVFFTLTNQRPTILHLFTRLTFSLSTSCQTHTRPPKILRCCPIFLLTISHISPSLAQIFPHTLSSSFTLAQLIRLCAYLPPSLKQQPPSSSPSSSFPSWLPPPHGLAALLHSSIVALQAGTVLQGSQDEATDLLLVLFGWGRVWLVGNGDGSELCVCAAKASFANILFILFAAHSLPPSLLPPSCTAA